LFRRKGIHTVLEAFLGLDTPFELHIVGDGPELAPVSALATDRRVFAHGWIDNADGRLRELFETASIFAFMSEAENFPICLLEAMAAGMAIVTSAGTGCADVVGDAGILIAPGDVEGVRSALARLIREPASIRAFGDTARRRLEQCFTWRSVADDHLRLYTDLLRDRRSASLDVAHAASSHSAATLHASSQTLDRTRFMGRAR
jgi:glycosyltransferase involved in cell wall biosynthesis